MLGHSLRATPSDGSKDAAGLNNLNKSFEKEGGPGVRPGSRARRADESNRAESSRVESERDTRRPPGGKHAREMGMDRATDKSQNCRLTRNEHTRGLQCSGAYAGPARLRSIPYALCGQKACSQKSARPVRPSVDQSVSQPERARSQSAGRRRARREGFHMPSRPLQGISLGVLYVYVVHSLQYTTHRIVWAWPGLCNGMHAQRMPSQKNPHTGVRQGPRQARQARQGGHRLIQLSSWLAPAIACGAVSCTVRRTDRRTDAAGRLHGCRFFSLISHVTRWDRIEPTLICPPRIPASRGRTRDPRR